jgi:hypothetical protein
MGKQLANLFPFVVFNVNLLISYDQSCLKIPEMSYLLLNCYNLFHFIMQCFFYLKVPHGRWFSPGTPASSTTKTGRHEIVEVLLKVALNTKNQIKSFKQLPVFLSCHRK